LIDKNFKNEIIIFLFFGAMLLADYSCKVLDFIPLVLLG